MVTVYKFVDKKLNIGTAYIGTPNLLKKFGNFHPVSPPFIIPYRYDIDRHEKFNDFNQNLVTNIFHDSTKLIYM